MKNSQVLMLFGLFFWVFFHTANSNPFSTDRPTYNVNLAPFIQLRSAYYCLQNTSSDCPGNFTLKVDGWLNITESQTKEFCEGGCARHTIEVLKCVWYVKHDYMFENKASIKNLADTINIGCNQHGFNGTSLYGGSGKSITTSLVTTLSALAFLGLFY